MFERKKLQNLNDIFIERGKRVADCVYFCRVNQYSNGVQEFLETYFEESRKNGVILKSPIANPDGNNLAYYEEMMGLAYIHDWRFIADCLKKWLPRMNQYQRETVAMAIYDTLEEMREEGKNANILKNVYIKFMCWLYYRFERIVNHLGGAQIPKILSEGVISNHQMKLLQVLSYAGCDIVLVQYDGGAGYLKIDPGEKYSDVYMDTEGKPFPEGFDFKKLQQDISNREKMKQLYGVLPQVDNCTNAWLTGTDFADFLLAPYLRGTDERFFYNFFVRIEGVEEKAVYLNELYQFQLQLKTNKRRVVICSDVIEKPTVEEIASIKRGNYKDKEALIQGLLPNINYAHSTVLRGVMAKAFVNCILEEEKNLANSNQLKNKAVSLLCWLNRYQGSLFGSWKYPETPCFIYLGGCKDDTEAMFLRFLSRLPVDVLVLVPNRNRTCMLKDSGLLELKYDTSMVVERFPVSDTAVSMGTAAYHAERELDSILYQDSGLYRSMQHQKASSVVLGTMYEEIRILWDKELKYRPNFSVVDAVVNIPVIFAKVSGVKNRDMPTYWSDIKDLMIQDTDIIKKAPYIKSTSPNPIKPFATEFFKNGKLQRGAIKKHKCYQYGFLREEVQEHILDKLEMMIEQRIIKGILENGVEYTVISTALNLQKDMLRMIQKFDFTKTNPKLIYINTKEEIISLEDSIFTAFLSLIGFDVVFFVPTGYQSVEKYFHNIPLKEHQIGEYVYDLEVPDFTNVPSSNSRQSWKSLFKRGR